MTSVLRALAGRCPHCGQAALFTGIYRTAEVCGGCGVRHERLDGTWVLAAGAASGLGLTLACALTVLWYRETGETLGPALPIGLAAAVMAVSYRVLKAVLFGLLHHVGLVTEDPDRVENVLFLQTIRDRRARRDEQERRGA